MKSFDKTSLNPGVASIAFAVLLLELSLIRVMDVILAPNTGYMALTSAMFALGLGGIYQRGCISNEMSRNMTSRKARKKTRIGKFRDFFLNLLAMPLQKLHGAPLLAKITM